MNTAYNKFHNTKCQTTLTADELNLVGYPEDSENQERIDRLYKSIKKRTCGSSKCGCVIEIF